MVQVVHNMSPKFCTGIFQTYFFCSVLQFLRPVRFLLPTTEQMDPALYPLMQRTFLNKKTKNNPCAKLENAYSELGENKTKKIRNKKMRNSVFK
jgi:predicted YcjX-like family ATPase